MQIHNIIDQLPAFRNAVVTIGTFDGVHLGHRQIIDKLTTEAKAIGGETVIITFHPHPRKVISSANLDFRLINTLGEKCSLLEQAGIDHVVVVPFTDAFANQSPEDYVKNFLVEKFHPHTIIIGYDHRFGKQRKGDYLLMEELAPVFRFILKEIPQQVLDEIAISSTRIREALLEGSIEVADKLLGYEFFFSGTVIQGDKLGRTLGYPTANLKIQDEEKIVPGNGVYAVFTQTGASPVRQKGMMNIGFRPTVDGKKKMIEVNIFDFDKEIYDQALTVFVKKHLRKEIKFNSLDELVQQLGKDKSDSLSVL